MADRPPRDPHRPLRDVLEDAGWVLEVQAGLSFGYRKGRAVLLADSSTLVQLYYVGAGGAATWRVSFEGAPLGVILAAGDAASRLP